MKILFGFGILWLFVSVAWSGNLPQLIALGQNATHESRLKFGKNQKFKDPKNRLNFSLNGRYTLAPDDSGGYKTKTGNLTTRLEYLLFDSGASRARDQIAIHSDILQYYKNAKSLNLTALQIGRIYFNAIALDDIIKLESELIKMLDPLLDEASFWVEFGDISSDEFDLLKNTLAHFAKEADELGFRRFELLTHVNLLGDGEIDFIAGSSFKMPKFGLVTSGKAESNLQLNLAAKQSATEEQSKLMPKIYFKDTQGFDIDSFRLYKRTGKELVSGYLAANRPMLEFSWKLPNQSSSKERQIRRIEEQRSALEFNDEIMLNKQRLDELKDRIVVLETRIFIDESKHARVIEELSRAIQRYAVGNMSADKMVILLEGIFENSANFILNVSELEISKMQWYFERGERLVDQIL
ncbi:hypothetical protein CCAL9344_07235 [Campylobacter sp. RM9344]|uniref:Uncharacterized protein n=1 Tax=Campylobacter californiensis TaxID=1032243 RepID=A0AAW3ZVC6_9BACT|nr:MULTISPECIES: hypothetical protein [unclassified Campylobacter]MBE2984961.1 hypothetical protein [Campylobacter sp. RM6883]MBE2995403.1 hypothetical protein [Campylobacter sp. RM6913]MBE3029974.1 hypothetical protein [Campylobacter sp. RM9344]MBE3608604.1 hypothetical protein [Campylobacter sp. RM9337]QCD49960.1 hypothetical protein CCAL_0020 [Campylobacter sp. RM6914]